MDVPLPRAASRRLMSFLTFHISMFFSASFGCGADMIAEGRRPKVAYSQERNRQNCEEREKVEGANVG